MLNTLTMDHVRAYLEAIGWNRYDGGQSWELHDVAGDYGEPGYSKSGPDSGLIFFGSWWERRPKYASRDRNGGTNGVLISFDSVYPRLSARLVELGCEFEWYDEWAVDSNADKAYRTTGDSYGWQPSVNWDDGEMLTPDDDITAWIDMAVNNPSRCINDRQVPDLATKLTDLGWTRVPPYDPNGYTSQYESGWHPGQTDDPNSISEALRTEHGDIDIVFELTENSQFYCGFVAWWKPCETDEED